MGICIYIYIYTYIHTYICVYIYIYIYAHTHPALQDMTELQIVALQEPADNGRADIEAIGSW